MAAKYPTQEEKHGMYAQLLRGKSEEYMRISFHKKYSRCPTQLYIELKRHDRKFQSLLVKEIFTPEQYDILLPPSKQTDSSNFDATLLFLLLRNLCGFRKPATGWNNEPDPIDRSEIANLVRLKIGRNRMQHLPPSMTHAQYKHIYLYVRQPLLDLGCSLHEICHARSFKYDNQPTIRSFLGREDELDHIHQVISNNQSIHGGIIAGIPGVGKTELARKYCQQYEDEFEHIIWVSCDSIENSLQDIAQSLKLDCRQDKGFKNLKVIAKLISEYFKNEKVLFVYDNCINGSGDLVDVLSPQHHNIITTQVKSWGRDYKTINIDVWPKEVALDFLKKNMPEGQDLLGQLTDEFNCHPLALQHAVAFIKEIGLSVKDYLELLSKHKQGILSQRVALQHGITKSVFSSFQITIDRIRNKKPTIYEFLSIFSVLDVNFMTEEFLQQNFKSRFDFIKAIRDLINFHMVKKCDKISEFSRRKQTFYTMHSLYQISIKADARGNEERIMKHILRMILKPTNQPYHLNWIHQFQYIWHQQSYLRKQMLQEITTNHLDIISSLFTDHKLAEDVINELHEEVKGKKDDITLYITEFVISLLATNQSLVDKTNAFKKILSEVEKNVSSSNPQKQQLIDQIVIFLHKMENSIPEELLFEGFYHVVLFTYNDVCDPVMKAICLKETRQHEKALNIFGKYEVVKNKTANAKLEICCCYILQGKIEEGLRLIKYLENDMIEYRVPLQIGRALFDVGCYKQSTYYLKEFQRTLHNGDHVLPYEILDGLCKLVCLNIPVAVPVKLEDQFYLQTNNLMIRLYFVLNCQLIRNYEYSKSLSLCETLLRFLYSIEDGERSRLWFREGLLTARHLMRRHEYFKALLIYKMIQRIQNEHHISEQTLDGEEIDVQQCINVCLLYWRKIFNI